MRDHSRSSITSGSSTARRRKACRSVRSEQASTWASRLSSLAPATLKRSRKRSSCLGLMAKTLKPRSSSASTTGPRGVSIAAAISAGSAPVFSTSHVHSSDNSAPPCVTSRSATHLPSASSRQTRCCALAQSTPTNQRTWSLIPFTSNRLRAYRDLSSIPVLALEAQTSYWTSVAAVLPGHMSYGGARGTGGHWSLPADRPVASLQADWLPNVMKGTGWANSPAAALAGGHGAIANLPTMQRRGRAPLPTLRSEDRHGIDRPDKARPMVVQKQRESVVRRHSRQGQSFIAGQRAHLGPFTKSETVECVKRDRHLVITAEIASESHGREIEVEADEVARLRHLEIEFLAQLATQRLDRIFPGVDAASEQAPVARIPDRRDVVAQLQKIARVLQDQQGGGCITRGERCVRGQEVDWQRHHRPLHSWARHGSGRWIAR